MSEEDAPMYDVQPTVETSVEEENPVDDVLAAFNSVQNIRLLGGATETAASFEFTGEDHTLGNALRYIIMKNPNVEFCGYSIPHPSEPKMNVRIQTYENTCTAYEALEKGFDDLADLCDVVGEKFSEERGVFGQSA